MEFQEREEKRTRSRLWHVRTKACSCCFAFKSIFPESFFVNCYPFVRRDLLHQLANQVIRNVFGLFEANAAFAHVELFLAGLGVFVLKPFEQTRHSVKPHVVEGNEVFLRSDTYERQGLFRIAMITCRIPAVRHCVTQHAIPHPFYKTFG